MKYFPLIWRGLWRKRLRTVFAMLAIVMAFVLFGTLKGVDTSIKLLMDNGRLNALVTNNPSGLPLPLADLEQIRSVKGVKAATYWSLALASYQTQTNVVPMLMADPDKFFEVYDPLLKASATDIAAWRRTRTGVLVTRAMALRNHWKVGDRVPLQIRNAPKKDGTSDWTFDIVGFVSLTGQGDRNIMVGGYPYFDTARSADAGTVTQYVEKIPEASQAAVISNAIDNQFVNSPARTRTQTERADAQATFSQLGDLDFFVDAIVAAAFATLLLLTGTTLMQSYRERIGELAVLKTLGFTDQGTAVLVLTESILLCAGAAVLGLVVAELVLIMAGISLAGFGLQALYVPPSTFMAGVSAALLLALLSALIPTLNARRLSIVAALATR